VFFALVNNGASVPLFFIYNYARFYLRIHPIIYLKILLERGGVFLRSSITAHLYHYFFICDFIILLFWLSFSSLLGDEKIV